MSKKAVLFANELSPYLSALGLSNFQLLKSQVSEITTELNQLNGINCLIFFTEATLQAFPVGFLEQFSKKNKVEIVLVYQDANVVTLFTLLTNHGSVNHLLSQNSIDLSESILRLCKNFESGSGKHCGFQPKRNFLSDLNLKDSQKIEFVESNKRWKVYDEIAEYVDKLGCFTEFSNIIRTVSSETITNAFYNGKRNHKSGLAFHGDRNVDFVLDPSEQVEVIYGLQEGSNKRRYFWILVTDPFGSTDRSTIICSLLRAAAERKPREGSSGGAGLGLLMLYEWCTAMHFIIEPGKSTMIACQLLLSKRNKIFSEEQRSIHISVD